MDKQLKVSQPIQMNFSVNLKSCLLTGEFIKQGQNTESIRYLQAYHNFILVFKNKEAKHPHKIIHLTFENKYELLRTPMEDKKVVGIPLGFRIELENSKHTIQYMSSNQELLRKWRDFLSGRINQRKFHESFKAHKKIGKGNFASVYLADRLEDQKSFAIKAFSKEVAYSQDKGKEAIKNEIQLMRELNHSSIIRLHEVYETDNSLYMVLDLLEGGSLYDKIKHRPTFNHKEIQILMKALLEGLQVMHSKRIMHRDLKPENILFRKLNVIESVCIADFGLATHADNETYLFIRCGTPGFVAPEVVNCKDVNAHYDPVCDVFSIGLIFYILLTGKPAFPGKSYNDVLLKNRKCEIVLEGPLFENVPTYSRDLLFKMLEKDPSKRITAEKALAHSYFGPQKINTSSSISTMEDGIVDDDEGEGSVGVQIQKMRDESIKFDMARINQLQNSPINSPIIAATSRFKKDEFNDPDFVMKTPLITGQIDSVQASPDLNPFNSPSAIKSHFQQVSSKRPSKFKDLTGEHEDEQKVDGEVQQQQGHQRVTSHTNPLHKYALQHQMQQNNQEYKQNKGNGLLNYFFSKKNKQKM